MAFSEMSVVTATAGRLASAASCCATRTSLDLVEMRTAIQIDNAASRGVKMSCASRSGGRIRAEDNVRHDDRREKRRQGLAKQELLAAHRRAENRLECPLRTLADH